MTVHVPAPIQESRMNDQAPAPCPFCGNSDLVIHDGDVDMPQVICSTSFGGCGASGGIDLDSVAGAIAAWNKRAAIAALHAWEAVATYGIRRKDTGAIVGVVPAKIAGTIPKSPEYARDYDEVPLFTAPPAPTHDALRELAEKWRASEPTGYDPCKAVDACADELTALLAQEPTDG